MTAAIKYHKCKRLTCASFDCLAYFISVLSSERNVVTLCCSASTSCCWNSSNCFSSVHTHQHTTSVTTQVTWLASPRSEAQVLVCLPVRGTPGECYYNTLLCCNFFMIECSIVRFLCTMRAFDVPASSQSPSLPLCQISFLWRFPLLS